MHSLNTASEYFFEVESFDSGLDYFYPRSEEVNGTGGEVEINKRTPGQRGGGYGSTTDTEEVYFKVGRMNLILDNLIATGKAKEMIINDVKPFIEANYKVKTSARGLRVTGTEIIGLVPRQVLLDAGRHFLKGKDAGEEELVQAAIRGMSLDDLCPFDPQRKVIEYMLG